MHGSRSFSFIRSARHGIWRRVSRSLVWLGCLAGCDAADEPATGEGSGPPPTPWSGCAVPCVEDFDAGVPGFGRCVANFDPAQSTAAAGGYGHEDAHLRASGAPGGREDVVSLGCGGSIVVDLGPAGAVDGPGADLIVFENPFSLEFPEAGQVSVSEDGCVWAAFDCDPVTLSGCAGVTPTLATPGSDLDARQPETAGGDAFDLADVGLTQVRFVRIEDQSAPYWMEVGGDWCDPGVGGKGGFDLDAIAVVHD